MKLVKLFSLTWFSLFILADNSYIIANNILELREKRSFETERKIFDLINKERNRKKIEELIWNPKLAELARSYSEKMARERFFSHFDRNGNDVAERAKNMRITKWKLIGENLFMSDDYEKIEQTAVKGWMKSPTHRDNILEEKFNETGVGLARSRDGMIYITQVFIQN